MRRTESLITTAIILLILLVVGITHEGPYANIPQRDDPHGAPSKFQHFYHSASKPPAKWAQLYLYRPAVKFKPDEQYLIFLNPDPIEEDGPATRVAELYLGNYTAVLVKPGAYTVLISSKDDFKTKPLLAKKKLTLKAGHNYFLLASEKPIIDAQKIKGARFVAPVVRELS